MQTDRFRSKVKGEELRSWKGAAFLVGSPEEVGRGLKIIRCTGLSIFWIPYQENRREESDELRQ